MKYFSKNLLILLILLATLCLPSCKEKNTEKKESPTVSPTVELIEREPLIISYIPLDDDENFVKGWELLAGYITEKTGIPVNLEVKNSYKEIIDGLISGEIDMAYIGALIYVKAREASGVYPIVKPGFENYTEPYYKSYIIVRKDSGITNLSELKGKKFAFTNKNSTSGFLIPLAMLLDNGINNLNYFSEYIFTSDQDSAFLSVYNKYVDGGAMYDRVLSDQPEEKVEEILVIAKSDPIPSGPVVVRKDIPKEQVELIKQALLNLGSEKETIEICDKLNITGYYEASDSDYDPVRKAVNALSQMGIPE